MMDFISQFSDVYIYYIKELWLSLAIGFFLSGLFYEFIPTHIVENHLGDKGIKPILISSLVGVLLPVCCFGSLPIAMTLRRKGARLGPVLAFLVATPATSISALIVCWKLLGIFFTFYIFFAVILMGLIMGVVGNRLKVTRPVHNNKSGDECCHECGEDQKKGHRDLGARIKGVFYYAFVTLPKELGLELLLGIAIASFLMIFEPLQEIIRHYLVGALGYGFVLIVGLATYVCSTANVPMADAFLKSGLSAGQAMTYLLIGPITSYGAILVLRKEFGWKILLIYLVVISASSLLLGIVFNLISIGN